MGNGSSSCPNNGGLLALLYCHFSHDEIIITDPIKFSFIGPIPEAMLGRISASSNVLQQYRKHSSVGPRELTPTMLRSIEEADKPAKRGKKPDTQKDGLVTKPTKGKTPKKRKTDKAATSQPQPKKQKQPARRLILQSSSGSDSEYVPPMQKNALPSESESESSYEEVSGRGDTPPRSPTPGIPVRSSPLSPPPVTILVSIPPVSPITTSQPSTTIPISTPIFTDTTTTTTTTKPNFTVPNPPSEDDNDEPITKHHLKEVNDKLDELLSSSSSGACSDAALKALFSSVVAERSASLFAAAKAIEASTSQCQQASLANAETVNTSVENLQKTLQSECSNIEVARHAIEEANESFHANVEERLTQLEADLAMENRIMDELDRRTTQLKLQTHKLRTANADIDDLKSEREVIRSSAADVHSILLSNRSKSFELIRNGNNDGQGVREPEGHYEKLVMAIDGSKGRFVGIFGCHLDLVIPDEQVDFREHRGSMKLIQQFINGGNTKRSITVIALRPR
ncbi:uncharacterized protein LOC128128026 [Lactuca sativa]|uniref:uncharacterized protein LOC128128026 n=1 Tax=Lactuca sativa TaxID=4236 RepID=UPI0022AEA2E6|nr:uncharacterized protein LOC128128026 [Lactuca sativa]